MNLRSLTEPASGRCQNCVELFNYLNLISNLHFKLVITLMEQNFHPSQKIKVLLVVTSNTLYNKEAFFFFFFDYDDIIENVDAVNYFGVRVVGVASTTSNINVVDYVDEIDYGDVVDYVHMSF